MEKIAVLGAGWGGLSVFCDLINRGYDVNLWNHNEQSLEPIIKREIIHILDTEGEFLINLNLNKIIISTDIKKVIRNTELIIMALPLHIQAKVAVKLAPFIGGQMILLLPGLSGSLEIYKIFKEMKINKDFLLIEGETLPMWGRRIEPGVIRTNFPNLRSKQKIDRIQKFSAFPAKRTKEAIEKLKDIYNYKASKNVLEVGVLNANFLIHPAPFIMNLGIIENSKGDFSLLNEGMSPSVIKIMEALDAEKLELCNSLRIEAISLEDMYGKTEGIIPAYLRKVPGPMGFRDKIPDVKNCRYLIEDTCGLVMWSSLGDLVGVETPLTDLFIRLANIIQGLDFWTFGRTVDKMGLTGMNIDEIEQYLFEGKK